MFKSKKIGQNTENVGKLLLYTRNEKKISINKVAQELNISEKYLKALENNQFEILPKGIYGKNFLREYALFLEIDPDEIKKLYNDQSSDQTEKNDPFLKKTPKKINFLTIPKIFRNIVIIMAVIIAIIYFGYYIKNITAPPFLEIHNLDDDITITENFIQITGNTDKEAEVKINDEILVINNNGMFTKDLNLNKGVNTILISSKKKYSRENLIMKKVLVE